MTRDHYRVKNEHGDTLAVLEITIDEFEINVTVNPIIHGEAHRPLAYMLGMNALTYPLDRNTRREKV